jgi:type VI secretion system secreted protein Hcp
VDFSFTVADQDNSEYLHVTLWDTGVSGFSMSSGGDRPSESISLNFSKIQFKDTSKKADGSAGDNLAVVYDLSKQTAG